MAHASPVFISDYDAEFCAFATPVKPMSHLYPSEFTIDGPAEGFPVENPRCRRLWSVLYFVMLAVVACCVGYQLGSSMFDLIVPAIGSVDEADVVQLGSDGQPIIVDPLQNWSKVHAVDGVEIVMGAPIMFGDDSRARRSSDASEAYLMYEISDMLQTVQIVTHLWDAAIAAAASNPMHEDSMSLDGDSILQRMGGAPFKMAALQGEDGEWIELTSTFTVLDTTPSGWAMGAFVVEDIPPCAMFKVIFNDVLSMQSRSAWRPQLAEVQMVFDQNGSA